MAPPKKMAKATKIMLYLDWEMRQYLNKLARHRKISLAELVRNIIELYRKKAVKR